MTTQPRIDRDEALRDALQTVACLHQQMQRELDQKQSDLEGAVGTSMSLRERLQDANAQLAEVSGERDSLLKRYIQTPAQALFCLSAVAAWFDGLDLENMAGGFTEAEAKLRECLGFLVDGTGKQMAAEERRLQIAECG